MRSLVVSTMFVAIVSLSTSAARAEFRELGTSSTGLAIWYGNVIEPPISVCVRFRLAVRDTIFEQVYLNGYPVLPELRREEAVTVAKPLDRVQLLHAAVRESTWVPAFRFLPPAEQGQAQARLFARQKDLVDSCTAYPSGPIRVYWKGGGHTDLTMHPPGPPLAVLSRQKLITAKQYLASLQRGSTFLLFSPNPRIVPSTAREKICQDVATLRNGGTVEPLFSVFRDSTMQELVRRPRPAPVEVD